jgi:putative ABC transport system permease protein
VNGATRRQLFNQFVVHTCLFFGIAIILAMLIMIAAMPLYNVIAGKQLTFNPFDLDLWAIIGIAWFVTFALSSVYPAMLLSSFHPSASLQSKIQSGGSFRKILVVGQFAFSIGLITCTMIIGKQLNFMMTSELGLDKSGVFVVPMEDMMPHFESVREELLRTPAIEGVSSGNGHIIGRWGATLDVSWEGKDPNQTFFMHDMIIDKDFIPLFNMDVIEGEAFSGSATDSAHFILNETAVKQTGIKDPIGKKFKWHNVEGIITGVVKDFHHTPLTQKINPFVFAYRPSSHLLYVKGNGPEAVAVVEKLWSKYNPGAPFDYKYLDDMHVRNYERDERTGNLFSLFTAIAIVISCLGLLGLITYTAQLKVKEISIRKVLGASTTSIVLLLSKNFIALITISIFIAIPTAWYAMNEWLSGFAYQTSTPWWIYVLACAVAVLVALLTIGTQSLKAAFENPVKGLKAE